MVEPSYQAGERIVTLECSERTFCVASDSSDRGLRLDRVGSLHHRRPSFSWSLHRRTGSMVGGRANSIKSPNWDVSSTRLSTRSSFVEQ